MNYSQQYQQAKENDTAEQMVSIIKTDWEEGEMIVGELIDITTVKFEETNSEVNGYIFNTDGGLIQFTMGAAVDMQAASKMVKGNVYACEFKGKKEISRGRTLNVFQVTDCGKATHSGKTKKQEKTD